MLPPGVRYWEFPMERHLSECQDEASVRYIICGMGGGITVSLRPCDAGVSCVDGVCENQQGCQDSDQGVDVHVAGEVTETDAAGNRRIHPDGCTDPTHVFEHFCEGQDRRWDIIECAQGEICRDGACAPGMLQEPMCQDSDGGIDAHVAGEVTATDAAGIRGINPDVCINPTHVYENFCEGQDRRWDAIECAQGEICRDGACAPGMLQEPICQDSDGGIDAHVAGEVTATDAAGNRGTNPDVCINPTHVYENFCEGQDRRWDAIECAGGEMCRLGACGPGCTDADPMNDPANPGPVTDINGAQHHDFCEGEILHQIDCAPDGTHENDPMDRIDCSQMGLHCQDGVCR